ncbi:FKBP-type peptidyl-prolyl cis-trans isomerase [Sphingomonas sp.]|uniref:FKBP-type peptidyl-prolyl cis-trans isomerase n=1 Tax=Sphingomonas sp. TaxID=28214 RepID=UPI001DA0863D|nr:FKBP-type peptidyl-prolyl cis-trans isomerase [Sphingomonas sp.]MBX9796717.1 FKBP-type peptidyl-prolyl cis-trans isomerase [Sphingomonas sp.]
MSITAVPIPPTKRGVLYLLWAGIVLAVLGGVALASMGAARVTASGLRYQVIRPGTGTPHPTDADIVLLNYEGRLTDGTLFDKSQQPTPMSPKQVVKGFGEALKLMSKGAKYRVWIKPELGYGDKPAGPIPPNSTLVFDIEVIDFLPESVLRERMQQQMLMQQMQGGAPGAPGAPAPGAPPR